MLLSIRWPSCINKRMKPISWHVLAEGRIRDAQAAGQFDNLPGFGQPLLTVIRSWNRVAVRGECMGECARILRRSSQSDGLFAQREALVLGPLDLQRDC